MVFKGVAAQLIEDKNQDAENDLAIANVHDNPESRANFDATGLLVPPVDDDLEIPTTNGPPKPTMDCDTTMEEADYADAVRAANYAQQFRVWCLAN